MVPSLFYLILSQGDFLTSRGICILACKEVNICPEGRRKTALAWSKLRALPLPVGDPLPGCNGWPWISHKAPCAVSCFDQRMGSAGCSVVGPRRCLVSGGQFLCTHCGLGTGGPEMDAVCGGWRLAPSLPRQRLGSNSLAGGEWDAGFQGWHGIWRLCHFLRSKDRPF